MKTTSIECFNLIKNHETISFSGNIQNKEISESENNKILLDFIKNNIDTAIQKLIKQELSQNQIDSIGSLIYNISIENFEKSELLIAINSDPNNMELISNKWEQFDKIKNKSEVKLFERIKKEVEYYFYGY